MRRSYLAGFAAAALLIFGLSGTPAFADACSDLIAFGRSKLGSVEDEKLQNQIKSLLDRAEQQCKGGNTQGGIETAKNAIEMIK